MDTFISVNDSGEELALFDRNISDSDNDNCPHPYIADDKAASVADVLKQGTRALLKLQQEIALLITKVADHVESLKGTVPLPHLRAFLVAECRIPSSEIRTYLEFGEKLEKHREVLVESGVTFQVMKALVRAPPAARSSAISRIAAGHLIGSTDVGKIAREFRTRSVPDDVAEDNERRATLRRICGKVMPGLIDDFEIRVDQFLSEAQEFDCEHIPVLDDDPDDWPVFDSVKNAAYDAAHIGLSRSATVLLERFKTLFGRDHLVPSSSFPIGITELLESGDLFEDELGDLVRKERQDAASVRRIEECERGYVRTKLAEAYEALKRISSGQFGFNGGSAMASRPGTFDSSELWDAISYLSRSWVPKEPTYWDRRHREKRGELRVVEICAGAGGQAIGLHAAGFTQATLYEKGRNAVATLRDSWPRWCVIERDISKGIPEWASRHGKVDLLAGGLPCQPFSAQGKKRGRNDPRDMWPAARQIVSTMRPRSFFFENVEGFKFRNFNEYRAEIVSDLNEMGYDVETHTIAGKKWGMAQDRNRIVMVGMPKGMMSRFKMPALDKAWDVGLSEAVGDLVAPYRSSPEDRATVDPSTPQGRYDAWADRWLELHASDVAPTITKFRANNAKANVRGWTNAGFDISKIADAPATLEEVTGIDYLPRITIPILQRLQGFPDRWRFHGGKTSVVMQIANAFPPNLAQAIGLAIRNALTGENLDIGLQMKTGFAEGSIGRLPIPSLNASKGWAEWRRRERAHNEAYSAKAYVPRSVS